jgi:MYXO-CTERM domain-containing protein
LGRVPFPLLILLGVFGVLASIGCVVGGGHPPILPLALIVAAVFVVRRRRMERRA